jgi:hypothetical protein
MSLTLTLVILLAAAALAGLANYRERRGHPPGKPPLVSLVAVQVVALLVVILMLAHLVSLLTGTQLVGRRMR